MAARAFFFRFAYEDLWESVDGAQNVEIKLAHPQFESGLKRAGTISRDDVATDFSESSLSLLLSRSEQPGS